MDEPIHILHLEDYAADAELVQATLVESGIACQTTRVQTAYEFRQALTDGRYDVILVDYTLPAYDGVSALQLARELCPTVPFIFVSGTMGENAAVEALIAGATDYVLKHRLSRLAPAVKRALHEAENLRERKRAESQRQQLEAQLLYAQKLESLGVLASGIAHDFNNILAGIRMFADVLQADPAVSPAAREKLAEIAKATRQGADLTRQILTYAGEAAVDVQPLDLSQIVADMKQMLDVAISKKAVLECRLAADLPKPQVDAGQIRQVIMNFVVNASEALGDKSGTISVATSEFVVNSERSLIGVSGEGLPPGRYVCLSVADTGCGMDQVTRKRIFDPFYTTKLAGRGLGLATVHGIIRAHRGALVVTSEPGKGSTFQVFLPAVSGTALPAVEDDSLQAAGRKGTGTVLVVDDDEMVRTGTQAVLQNAGFQVVTARDGHEALDVFGRFQNQIVCVVLGLTMPSLSGAEVLAELRRMAPGVRVILTSGYPAEAMMQRFAGQNVFGFVQKPDPLDAMITQLQDSLEGCVQRAAEATKAGTAVLPPPATSKRNGRP